MNVVCVGGARCVWDDLGQIPASWPDLWIACNDIAITLPKLDHLVSLHADKLDGWIAARKLHHDDEFQVWTRYLPAGVPSPVKHSPLHQVDHWGGSSGLLAVRVALHIGATSVVCAGIPMDMQPHFHRPKRWKAGRKGGEYRKDWRRHVGKLGDVRSLSGWTRDLLGAPEW